MAEEKEVTRAELEGRLWAELQRISLNSSGGGEPWVAAARLLHESIRIREKDAAAKARRRIPPPTQ